MELSYLWKISPQDVMALDDSIQATMLDIANEIAQEADHGK